MTLGYTGKNVGKHFLVLFEIKNCHIWWKRRHDQKKYKKRRPHRIFVNWICYAVIISLWFTYTTRSEKVVTSRQILSTKNRKTGITFVFCQKSKMCITSFVKVGNNFHFIIKTTTIYWNLLRIFKIEAHSSNGEGFAAEGRPFRINAFTALNFLSILLRFKVEWWKEKKGRNLQIDKFFNEIARSFRINSSFILFHTTHNNSYYISL